MALRSPRNREQEANEKYGDDAHCEPDREKTHFLAHGAKSSSIRANDPANSTAHKTVKSSLNINTRKTIVHRNDVALRTFC